jgi:hypothetical protein
MAGTAGASNNGPVTATQNDSEGVLKSTNAALGSPFKPAEDFTVENSTYHEIDQRQVALCAAMGFEHPEQARDALKDPAKLQHFEDVFKRDGNALALDGLTKFKYLEKVETQMANKPQGLAQERTGPSSTWTPR